MVPAFLSEGGYLSYDEGGDLPPAVVTVVNTSGEPISVETSDRVKAWVRDHYREDGTFRCPASPDSQAE